MLDPQQEARLLGKASGLLERSSDVGEFFPLLRSRMSVIPRSQWMGLIQAHKPDLRPFVYVIFDQGQVGSCAAEASTQALQICRSCSGLPKIVLNPWFVYHHTCRYKSGDGGGSTLDDCLRFISNSGCAPEHIWGRRHGFITKPSEAAYKAAKDYLIAEVYDVLTVEELGTCLLCGFPVVFGWRGHAAVLTKLLSTSQAQYVNSWSVNWGDSGFGTIDLGAVEFRYGAFAVRTTYWEVDRLARARESVPFQT